MTAKKIKIYDAESDIVCVAPNTWTVSSAFSDSTLDWLQNIYINESNEFQVSRPHYRMMLKNGADQQRIDAIGQAMSQSLSQITEHQLKFMTSKYWVDMPGFGCQVHSDHPDILVSYQIYLNVPPDNDQLRLPCYGAEFLHVDPPYTVELKPNHGYINLNVDSKLHQVWRGSGVRVSVMFQYARQ